MRSASRESNFPLADVFGVDYESEERKYAYTKEGRSAATAISPPPIWNPPVAPLAKLLAVSTVGLPGSFVKTEAHDRRKK